MSKRKLPTALTLWRAANVLGHETMEKWFNNTTPCRVLVDSTAPGMGLDVKDVSDTPGMEIIREKEAQKTENENIRSTKRQKRIDEGKKVKKLRPEVESTCSVGLKPTAKQKKVLNLMLRVSNTAYNWCVWLVREHGIEPLHYTLQKYVATNSRDPRPYGLNRVSEGVKDCIRGARRFECKKYCEKRKSSQQGQQRSHASLVALQTQTISSASSRRNGLPLHHTRRKIHF